ncbi:MAG TPA: hypothetical protein VLT36_20255 [Candidatus Dormibacteraeota bacterium]|nr:hypothetical protein [Candidatus Dormibacteraeota bacterium]
MRNLVVGFSFLCISGGLVLAQPSNPSVSTNPGQTNQNLLAGGTGATVVPQGGGPTPAPGGQSGSPAGTTNVKSEGPEWAKWAGNLVATVNLGIVCYLFMQTQTARRKERQEDVSRSVALFWVQDLILKPNIETLHKFFNKYDGDMEAVCKAQEMGTAGDMQARAQERISAFKVDYHEVRRKVLEPLTMVSAYFRALGDTLSTIEDLVTEEYARIPGVARADPSPDGSPLVRYRDLRQGFFTALHQGQLQLVRIPDEGSIERAGTAAPLSASAA